MAITNYTFLDESGVSTLASGILAKANVRIAERIQQSLSSTSDANHVLSTQALYALLGALSDTDVASALTTGGDTDVTIANQLNKLNTNIGNLDSLVKSLTHLTLQTVEGALSATTTLTDLITAMDDPNGEAGDKLAPRSDVIYLQHDDPTDDTWVMYIYTALPEAGVDETGTYIAIGETKATLENYWDKSAESVAELRSTLNIHDVTPITAETINNAVDTAFAANDPLGTGA